MKTQPGVYRHWNSDHYRVLFVATDASNAAGRGQKLVVYVALDTGRIYTRPEAEFHELVRRTLPDPTAVCWCDVSAWYGECRQHPSDTQMVPRFELISRTEEM